MSRLLAAAACFAERIKVNSLTREVRDGRPLWIKHRRWPAGFIMACANGFFRLAGNPVRALGDPASWQRWELECFRQLHGEDYQAFRHGPRGVAAEEMPGESLARHLDLGMLTPEMAAAAGRELRRAHEWQCPVFAGGWSHGDPHTGNFLYDQAEDRARLIDFEVMHDRALSPDERHADDLLVFLQDVLGRIAAGVWLATAQAFLEGYDRAGIAARLVPRLILPRGIPRLWWAVRTTYLPAPELANRLELLREALIRQQSAMRR
ncbi:MAG: hypothetical protein QOE70_1009 [Chthoniobacter sp.]|jgi:hypothetical protein|nr:hypothetical protein [Chthoniobacter sp.]